MRLHRGLRIAGIPQNFFVETWKPVVPYRWITLHFSHKVHNVSTNIETRIKGFTIRFAEENDARIIFGMIRELAEYEKLLDKFDATEELLRESLFQHNVAETLIGDYQRKPVGYAIFFHNFSSFNGRLGIYIEDLYVKPEMRGKGFGEALLSFIAKLAVERKCGRLEWSCLDWNTPSIAFYKRIGAASMDEWTMYRLTGKNLEKAASEF
jgi:GNAT superfamily N-acetyltransferase